LLISSSSRFVLFFHSPFSYLGPYNNSLLVLENTLWCVVILGWQI
jgi:hypothetical protein